jgi:molecular chaperone HtpG
LTAGGEVSLEMERVLNAMPNAEGNVRAERVLELNTEHPVFAKLCALFAADKDRAGELVDVLYDHACMSVGLSIDNPADYVAKVTKLLTE